MTAESQPVTPVSPAAQAVGEVAARVAAGSPSASAADLVAAPTEGVAASALPMGWREALATSVAIIRERPALIGVGLLGFLARGGLVLFLLPIVALPTPIGISTFIGGTALTGAGASDGLIRLLVGAIVGVALLVAAGVVVGAIADILLAREAMDAARVVERRGVVEPGRDVERREAAPISAGEAARGLAVTRGLVARLLVVRCVTLLPVGLAVAWAATRLVAAGYQQLILPDDLSIPLGVRILLEALDAALVVLVVWLIAELVGGVAVRHVIVDDRSAAAALGLAVAGIVRRPLTSLAGHALGVIGLAIAAGPALLIAAALWSRLQALLADDVAILLLLPATFIFVLVWIGGLVAVGVVTAWRGVLGTLDVLRARRASVPLSGRSVLDALNPTTAGPEVVLQEG